MSLIVFKSSKSLYCECLSGLDNGGQRAKCYSESFPYTKAILATSFKEKDDKVRDKVIPWCSDINNAEINDLLFKASQMYDV